MRKFAWVASLTILILLASACQGNENPVETDPAPASKVTPGVYDLSAPMKDFDQWEFGAKTFSHSAILTIQHSSTDGSRVTGRFTDFRNIADGQQSFCCYTGALNGVVDRDGGVSLELKRDDGTVIWIGTGSIIAGMRIEGTWKVRYWTGELSVDFGPFAAELRKDP